MNKIKREGGGGRGITMKFGTLGKTSKGWGGGCWRVRGGQLSQEDGEGSSVLQRFKDPHCRSSPMVSDCRSQAQCQSQCRTAPDLKKSPGEGGALPDPTLSQCTTH